MVDALENCLVNVYFDESAKFCKVKYCEIVSEALSMKNCILWQHSINAPTKTIYFMIPNRWLQF